LKRVLIISPHFPPINAADMHRVRASLPYFKELGWSAEVVAVHPEYVESYSTDEMLLRTIPDDVTIHLVKAWKPEKTRRFGLGSLSIRSFFFYKRKVNQLLRKKKFDLIYFSTTAFHVMALGPYWKRKFGTPFILDIQDPWRNDYYLSKPKAERPPKFRISYAIDKYLEAKTIPYADGIISVSEGYLKTFQERYRNFSPKVKSTIPFSVSETDFEILKSAHVSSSIKMKEGKINVVYIGRGGFDLQFSLTIFFRALKLGLDRGYKDFSNIHSWFIGTSYAPVGSGLKTIKPIADSEGIDKYVTEITDRIPYFEALSVLQNADILFVPGSADSNYTASKILPYIFSKRPLLAIFHKESSVVRILQNAKVGVCISFSSTDSIQETLIEEVCTALRKMIENRVEAVGYNRTGIQSYLVEEMVKRQVACFNTICA